MQTQDKQGFVVNGLIAQGMDFLFTAPNASPSNPPTVVMHDWTSGYVVSVYWDGQIIPSGMSASDWRSIEHWPLPVASAS